MRTVSAVTTKIYGKISLNTMDYDGLLALMIHDKKNIGGQINFVLLNDFESFEFDCAVKKELIVEALDYYMA